MSSKVDKALIVSCVVLIVLGAVATAIIAGNEPKAAPGPMDLALLSTEVRARVTALMGYHNRAGPTELEALIGEDVATFLSSDPGMVEGYIVSARSVNVDVREDLLPLAATYPPETVLTVKGLVYPNSDLFGSAGAIPGLPILKAEVDVELDCRPDDGSTASTSGFRLEVIQMDPERTLGSLLNLMGNDMDGWGSSLARDMEYMLTSLVRMRTVRLGVGTKPFDTSLNILNEGDLELSYNIALGLCIARWTGRSPEGLLGEIDRFFSETDLATSMNPTGSRIWGEAERDAFVSYKDRVSSGGNPRMISDLLGSALIAGHSDTADIYLKYLHMDARTSTSERLDPLDNKGPLEELDLLNSRQRKDPYDTYSLECHPSYPKSSGIVLPEGITNGNEPMAIASIEPSRGYSIIGKDLRVTGLNDYLAWFTNADPDLNEEDLINYGYDIPTGTRCGAILPPPEPPSHDYRIQWDLTITAVINLTGTLKGQVGSSVPEGPVTREIRVSFPLRVHTWFQTEPNRDGGIRIVNLNTGNMEITPISTRWVITPKANATEYFERFAFQDLREGISVGMSLLRSLSYRERVLDPSGARTSAQVNALSSIPALMAWVSKGGLTKDLAILNYIYLKEKGLKPDSLGTIDTDGLAIHLGYLQAKDRMDITVKAPKGSLVISLTPLSSSTPDVSLRVTTPKGMEVTVEPLKKSFKVSGSLDGAYLKEGALDPSLPTKAMTELLLQDSAYLASPPLMFNTTCPSSPYEAARQGSGIDLMAAPAVHLVLAGPLKGIEDMGSELPAIVPGVEGPGLNLAPYLTEIMTMSASEGLWAGAVVIWNGENGTTPLTRTVLFRASEGADLSMARAYVLQAIWSPYIGIKGVLTVQEEDSIEVMVLDRVPSWAIPLDASGEGTDLVLASHYRFEPGAGSNVLSLNAFAQSSMDGPSFDPAMTGWTLVPQKATSPLW